MRENVVSCQVIVYTMGMAVTVLLRIKNQNFPAATAQHNSCIQSGRASSYNNAIINLHIYFIERFSVANRVLARVTALRWPELSNA